jgi:hypothetical protein
MKFNVTKHKQCIFDSSRQLRLVNNNTNLIDYIKQATSIKDWNARRDAIKNSFDSLPNEEKELLKIMFLGYIDTNVFKSIKHKLA